jgi:hypothetical protein
MKLLRNGFLLIILLSILSGCNQKQSVFYSAPAAEDIVRYVSENQLEVLDSAWVMDSAIILSSNSLINLYIDQDGKAQYQKLSWGSNSTEPVIIGDGMPYIAIILNDRLMGMGADQLEITFSDKSKYFRGISNQKGYIITNPLNRKVDKIVLKDKENNVIYER